MRTKLPLAAHLYIWSTVALAAALTALWLVLWPAPALPQGTPLFLVGLLLALAIAATAVPLHIGPRHDIDVSTAVYFAALLLFGVPVALGIVGTSRIAGEMLASIQRHVRLRRPLRSARNIAFNTAQWMTAVALAGAVYHLLLPPVAPASFTRLQNLLAIPLAAVTLHAANSLAVAGIIAIQQREPLLDVWLRGRKRAALHEAGLLLLGLVTARTAESDPWIPLVMVLPTWIIYLATKRNVDLTEQTIAAVEALADVVDRRDRYTYEHSRRVAEYATRIARAMRLPSAEVDTIRLAARVHDLGKIGVPNEVLHKNGPLTLDEWEVMRRHPAVGGEILARFPDYRAGRLLVVSHHERYDGKGYPHGATGARMPMGAQIIAVADTLDAMTSDRPYRRGLPLEVALAELRRGAGTQFNPEVVAALERLAAEDAARGEVRFGMAPAAVVPSSAPAAPEAQAAAAPAGGPQAPHPATSAGAVPALSA